MPLEVIVEALDKHAFGIAHSDGLELRIAGAAPGDTVSVHIEHQSPHQPVAWCGVSQAKSRGTTFRKPACPHAWPVRGRCGGCPALHLSPELQYRMKRQRVIDALKGEDLSSEVAWFPSPILNKYRIRGQFVPAKHGYGAFLLGSYAPRSHQVVSMDHCLALREPISKVAMALAELFTAMRVPCYPENNALRYVTLRASVFGEVLLNLVISENNVPWIEELIKQIMLFKEVVGLSVAVNETAGNAINAGPSIHLAGKETIIEPIGKLSLEMSAAGFSQLNSEVAARMYEYARSETLGAKIIWDFYCGLGGLGLTAAFGRDTQLFGVDSVEAALILAKRNASRAQVNARYECRDLTKSYPEAWPRPDVVLVNPPRRGLDPLVLDGLKGLPASRIIYMSCNPGSFARDARRLVSGQWKIGKVYAYDMLPGTTHVEVISAFER